MLCSDEKKLNHSTLVYGEIKFDSYGIAFEKVALVVHAGLLSMYSEVGIVAVVLDQEQVRRTSRTRRYIL